MLVYLLLTFIIVAFVISFSFYKKQNKQSKQLDFKTNTDLYDKEYVELYDVVTYDYYRVQKDINTIMQTTSKDSYLLDIGSGTGHHVDELNKKGVKAIGIDDSAAMVHYAKKNKNRYIEGDMLDMSAFQEESFTHITCFYYTLYYIKNKKQCINNVYKWLAPGGLFIVHLTNKCTYGKNKIVDNEYTYKRTIRDNKVYETISKDNKIRRNEHVFYIEPVSSIVQIVQQRGFIVVSSEKYDTYNYLYVFKKPE
jgi:ubiquinone/menaquinone biosynthesis C-methylase UbiE